jgi:orotate phosphoribosyltransferase
MEEMKTALCRALHKIGALKFGVFKLTSGRTSPYYVDLRIIPSFPDVFQRVSDVYVKLIREELGKEGFDRIAGIPTAGIPFASLIAYQLKKPFIYIRQLTRLHGRERRIEGLIMPGDRVLLIDDLITTGGSIRKAAQAIRAEGGVVNHALVLLDREESGKQRLSEDNITLHYLLTASEAAEKLYEAGAIDDEQLKTILRQVKKK